MFDCSFCGLVVFWSDDCSSYLNSCEHTPQLSSFDHCTVFAIVFSSCLMFQRPKGIVGILDIGEARVLRRRARTGRRCIMIFATMAIYERIVLEYNAGLGVSIL